MMLEHAHAVIVTLVGAYEECGRGMRRYQKRRPSSWSRRRRRWCAEANIDTDEMESGRGIKTREMGTQTQEQERTGEKGQGGVR